MYDGVLVMADGQTEVTNYSYHNFHLTYDYFSLVYNLLLSSLKFDYTN
jgi:hypothetical protein